MARAQVAFPAMRGKMGNHEYFVSMVDLENIPSLFENYLDRKVKQAEDKAELDLTTEAQRRLSLKRIPEIKDYILNNRESYVFSSLTAAYESATFVPVSNDNPDIGSLRFDRFSKFHINDGQHRAAAIRQALMDWPELGSHTISVVFFKVNTPRRMQQLFTDLNRSVVRVSGGVVIAMGGLPIEQLTVEVVRSTPYLDKLTELEKSSASLTSDKLFALSAIHQAHINLIGKSIRPEQVSKFVPSLKSFWEDLYAAMPLWQRVHEGVRDAYQVKLTSISHHATILRSLATILRIAMKVDEREYRRVLKEISQLNWSKKNGYWLGKAVNENGGVINNKTAERLIIKNLRKKFELVVTEELEALVS